MATDATVNKERRITMKTKLRAIALILAMSIVMMAFAACTAVQVSGQLVINEDGTGSRQLVAQIAKNDDLGDGYGSAYYYLKLHGDALQAKIAEIYAQNVDGSADWLNITVDDTAEDWEVITISFDFESLEDYTAKLHALAYDETAAAAYDDPAFTRNEDGTFTYTENSQVITAIYKSLQLSIMADESAYDPACTKDGVALSDGSADGQLEDSGVEIIKGENGQALTIQVDGGAVIPVSNTDGIFSFTGATDGTQAVVEHKTSCVLHYSFDDTLANSGTEADNDLQYGAGSTEGGPVYEEGLSGKAISLDGATYLASPNKTYSYPEMTIAFYYRMDAYTETDTGANMIIVPAGLGALSAGVIDVEFIKDSGAEGVQLLGKMNSADWQTQDKLFSEEYYMENRLNQWHHYALVFSNEYDDAGEIADSFVFMYIDGKLATRSRLSVAAGLPFGLGSFDDGSFGTPNGGFNVGGYFENDTVKRTCTGALDELMVFDGALTEEEINSLCYTAKVSTEYDPNAQEPAATEPAEAPTTTPSAPAEAAPQSGSSAGVWIAVAVIAVIAVVAIVVVVRKKGTKKAE